ncbi:MAG TPA: fatty acid desaturase [Thermoanaerobaculia bacterium]|nr:fatty acid desaturase [Thermoanaerobaculia bacterium]
MSRSEAIPGALNVAVTAAAVAADLFLLGFASHTESWGWRIAAAVAFSFVNNTVFSLLHEAVHGVFHPRRAVNDAFGMLTAAFFPTGYTFQRVCHLGHHRRNRSDVELFDYFLPDDNRPLKAAQWYGILTGVYWLLPPLACLAYLLCPWLFRLPLLSPEAARQTSADAMLSGFEGAPAGRMRLEILFSISMQAAMVWALDLSFAGWLACYAAFALNWSSLQYADHAWSVRDVHDGAWNLRVNRIVQYLFLNYHHHRAHHQHPSVPWLHLPRYVDFSEERPSFLRIYLRMWRGPRPWPGEEAP